MMMRGCPASGRMFHRFDAASHRCACGRWERGFKPKSEPVAPRAECQICERSQAVDGNGCLGHHGYKRPGCGYIFGDCMGVSHLPYPAIDALELYLVAVKNFIARCKTEIAELLVSTEISWTCEVRTGRFEREKRTVTLRKDEPSPHVPGWCVPDFEARLKVEVAKVENDLRFAEKDEVRVVARIARALEMSK